MSVSTPIPSSFNVLGFVCRTWYSGQPVRCGICKEPHHLPRACPLSGLCRRCKQPGHVAVSVGRLGASLVLRLLFLFLIQIQFLFQLIQFLMTQFLTFLSLTTLILFLLLAPGMTGTCPLSPRTILILLLPILFLFLFLSTRLLLLMMFPAVLVLSTLNVFRPSQLPFRSLHLKFLCFQRPSLCPFVSEYCFCVRSFCSNF